MEPTSEAQQGRNQRALSLLATLQAYLGILLLRSLQLVLYLGPSHKHSNNNPRNLLFSDRPWTRQKVVKNLHDRPGRQPNLHTSIAYWNVGKRDRWLKLGKAAVSKISLVFSWDSMISGGGQESLAQAAQMILPGMA